MEQNKAQKPDAGNPQTEPKKRCFLCGKNHAICYCLAFRRMLWDERRAALQTQPICLNCLGFGHKRADCQSVNRCSVCGYKHHTMLHHGYSSIGSSSVEDLSVKPVPMTAKPKTAKPVIEADFKRLTLGEGSVPTTMPSPLMDPIRLVAPVVECMLRAGDRQKKVTLMILEEVPKSQLRFHEVETLRYPTKFKNNTAYGQFKIDVPAGGHLTEWFIIVDKFKAKIEPSVKTQQLLFCLQQVGPVAHPEPHLYSTVHGIIGRDLARRVCFGEWKSTDSRPSVKTKQTMFGIIGSGIWENDPFSIDQLP